MQSRPVTPTPQSQEARRKSLRSSGVFRAIGPIIQSPEKHYPREILPLDTKENIARLRAISDAFAALRKNMDELAIMHKAVVGFNESFASFLYGLMITTFCVNFKDGPTKEKYEALVEEQSDDEQMVELEARLIAARRRNAHLKQLMAQKMAENKPKSQIENLSIQRPQRVPSSRPFVPRSSQKKIPVLRDESFSTTDTFIEAPGTARVGIASSKASGSHTNTVPNLNQAPRYMRGLFEIPGASNKSRIPTHRVEKKPGARSAIRPPQKASYRNAGTAATAQRTAGSASNYAQRSAISAAAQRAQKARANRMSSRPPFR